MTLTFENFKQIYNDLICENALGLIDADEAQELIDHPANKEIVKTFKQYFNNKIKKLNKQFKTNTQVKYELFEPRDEDDYNEGANFAHVNENDPNVIYINLFWLANYIDEDMSIEECIHEYESENMLEHEFAHVLDIKENGKRKFEDQHNDQWKKLFNMILTGNK